MNIIFLKNQQNKNRQKQKGCFFSEACIYSVYFCFFIANQLFPNNRQFKGSG